MTGIYKIENLINHKCYIGQAKNIEKRWKDHKKDSKSELSIKYNYPLYCAFRKYGLEYFSFEILEECKIEELNEREIYYIQAFNSFYNGYNQTLGGDHSINNPKENIIGIIHDLEYSSLTISELIEKWSMSKEMICGINTGRWWKQDNIEYPIRKKAIIKTKDGKVVEKQTSHTKKIENFCLECGKQLKTSTSNMCQECSAKARRKVERPTSEELELKLKELKSFTAVGKYYGVSDKMISKWCKTYDMPTNISAYKPLAKEKQEKTLPKSVHMIDAETNKVLRTFCSILEAERFLGLEKPGQVSKVCRGIRKTAYGYKWAFAE